MATTRAAEKAKQSVFLAPVAFFSLCNDVDHATLPPQGAPPPYVEGQPINKSHNLVLHSHKDGQTFKLLKLVDYHFFERFDRVIVMVWSPYEQRSKSALEHFLSLSKQAKYQNKLFYAVGCVDKGADVTKAAFIQFARSRNTATVPCFHCPYPKEDVMGQLHLPWYFAFERPTDWQETRLTYRGTEIPLEQSG